MGDSWRLRCKVFVQSNIWNVKGIPLGVETLFHGLYFLMKFICCKKNELVFVQSNVDGKRNSACHYDPADNDDTTDNDDAGDNDDGENDEVALLEVEVRWRSHATEVITPENWTKGIHGFHFDEDHDDHDELGDRGADSDIEEV